MGVLSPLPESQHAADQNQRAATGQAQAKYSIAVSLQEKKTYYPYDKSLGIPWEYTLPMFQPIHMYIPGVHHLRIRVLGSLIAQLRFTITLNRHLRIPLH